MPYVSARELPPDGFRGGHRRPAGRRVRRARRIGLAGLVATAVAVTVATFTAGSAQAAGMSVAYAQTARWDSGYTGTYTVTNTSGDDVEHWSLTFALAPGARLDKVWNGKATVRGADVTVANESWNGHLAPDASVVVGFVADASGAEQAPPAQCTINGVSCGKPGPRPSSPSPTATPTRAVGSGALPPETSATSSPPESVPPAEPSAAAPSAAPPAGSSSDGPIFSPYVDVLLNPPFDLADAAARTGVRRYTLGFLVAADGCAPSWGGVLPVGDPGLAERIAALRSAGGDVRIAFGGANGPELATVCDTPDDLADAYQRAIDAYDATMVDFDVEGGALADSSANAKRAAAIGILRARNRGLDVSVTLPALPQGLTQAGVDLLAGAADAGIDFDAVNLMAMDYGDAAAPDPDGRMGRFAIDAVTAAQAQVRGVFGLSDDEAWRRLAVTPMIGVNDVATEVFSLTDAAAVARFVREKNLAWYAMWSANRDVPCPGGPRPAAQPTCSGVAQEQSAFTGAFLGQ
ncbi:cellulose binding domain-containing protein [Cryptosporangium phraense]|uniref:Sugar hydrolase n=1 Tax=Cryptosporangium phraense TaxID=2593070 RepID=A0A545ATS9_9ACTN|nr:cellulose binding domain-containing protein [Cryptosporangium phraense]TQS44713.1 sugar hydrolase [Cryptosporangium phraense]